MNTALRLVWAKLLHTVIWLFMVIVIFYVLYCGLADDINVYTWITVGLIVAEGLVLLLFRGYCPLTLIARKYVDSDRDDFDIFLPN